MRNWFKTIIGFLAAFVLAGAFAGSVYGVPAFARQTGLECSSCHASAPGFPSLNSFGAAFKAGGYTMGNEDSMIGDGERLSIPATLPLSVVTKIRGFYNTDQAGNTTKELDNPDEWAFFFGGRVGKNVGYAVEFNEGGPLGFKMPIVIDAGPAKIGIVPFWTDAAGPGWAFETASTGQVSNIRMAERKTASAFKYSGAALGEASGVGIYVWHPMAFLTYAGYAIAPAASGVVDPTLGHYIRGAVTPAFGGLEALVGFSYRTGTNVSDVNSATLHSDLGYYSVDAQIMGNVGIPLGAFVTYFAETGDPNGDGENPSRLALYVEAGLLPDLVNVGLGYGMSLTDVSANDTDSELIIVAKWFILANLRLEVDYTYWITEAAAAGKGGRSEAMLMLFGAF